jgi:hypothetical protein
MKINIRNEPATEADNPPGSQATPAQTCVWIVGDDDAGTLDTAYLAEGQQVSIDVGTGVEITQTAQLGEVEAMVAPEPAAEAGETAEPDSGSSGELEPGEQEGHV